MEAFFMLLALVMESTGHSWIPFTKASDAELWWFLLFVPEQTVEKTLKTPVIRTPSHSLWRHCNILQYTNYTLYSVMYWISYLF